MSGMEPVARDRAEMHSANMSMIPENAKSENQARIERFKTVMEHRGVFLGSCEEKKFGMNLESQGCH